MTATVTQLHPLKALATQLREDVAFTNQGRDQWIEGMLRQAKHLREARQHFGENDTAFGIWLAQEQIRIGHNDRVALITMGEHPDKFHTVLSEQSKTLHANTIWEKHKDTFPKIGKVSNQPKKTKSGDRKKKSDTGSGPQPRRRKQATEKIQSVRPLIRETVEAEGTVENKIKWSEDLKNILGYTVSVDTIERAQGEELARLGGIAEAKAVVVEPLDPAEMKPSTKQRINATVRAEEKRLRQEIGAERLKYKDEVHREFDIFLSHWKDKIARAERILASHKGVMNRKNFRIVLAGLHPDHNKFEQAAEAFELFKGLEQVLVIPETPAIDAPPLPGSVAELMAQRKQRRTH